MGDLVVVRSGDMTADTRRAIVALCEEAFEEPLAKLFETFGPATHVVARMNNGLVSHAMWVTRWLAVGNGSPCRAAYVELVATRPGYRGRGLATAVMSRLAETLPDACVVAALCPAETGLYRRLGWVPWRGPLGIRLPRGDMLPTPDERVMLLPLPGRPRFDFDAPLSAEWRPGELW